MSLDVFPMYLHCIRSLRFFESCWFFSHTNRHLLSTSVTCHGMVFLCFCIVYVRYTFWKMYLIYFFLIQFSCIYLSTFVTCHGMFFLCICIVYVRYIFLRDAVFFSHKQASLVYNRYMSWDGFPMFCIVYVRYTFWKMYLIYFFLIQFSCINCLRSLHVIRCFSYVFALYRFVTFFWVLLVFSHTNRHLLSTSVTCHARVFLCFCIVYVRYTFWKMYLIFFWFSSAVYTCLRSLHVFRCFSYVSVLYTFVTFFERLTGVFFNKQALSTSVTCLRMVFLCISAVYIRYTIWYSDNLDSSQLYVGGYTIFFPRSTPNNMFASSTFVYAVTV